MTRHPQPLFILALLALPILSPAEIDSGGGKSSGGPAFNHSSIGGPFATLTTQGGTTLNHPGFIEVIYPVTPASITDTNANGLADGWEIQHFGGLGVDPNADADHDGTSNFLEYLAGTDPNDAKSVFRPQGTLTAGIYHLAIPTVTGRNYQIWVARDMKNWSL